MLIPLLVRHAAHCSQPDSAEAPVKHQALQEQIPLQTMTFPAAPELEAPLARSIRGHLGLNYDLHVTEGGVLPSGAANTLEYVLLIPLLVNIL